MLRCKNNALYTGIAKDVLKRLAIHQSGKGSKSLHAMGLPVTLVYTEIVGDYSSALKREHAVKKLSRIEKEKLVEKQLPKLG
jgi:putative endonuclease